MSRTFRSAALPRWRAGRDVLRRDGISFTDRARSLLVAGVLLAIAGVLLGFIDLVRLGGLLVILPLTAALVGFWRRPALSVTRTVTPSPVPAGGTADVITTIQHSGRHGMSASHVEETVVHPGEGRPGAVDVRRFDVPALAPGAVARLHHTVSPSRRGRHRLGPVVASVTDPFGLVRMSARVPAVEEFVALTPCGTLGGAVTSTDGHEATEVASLVPRASGEPSATVREYRFGDDPRRIHWTASARGGDLLVRVEEQANTRRAVLVCDQSFSGAPGRGLAGLDWAVELLASAAISLAAGGHTLHLVTHDRAGDPRAGEPISAEDAVIHLSVLTPAAEVEEAETERLQALAAGLAAEGGLLVVAVPAHAHLADPLLSLRPVNATGLIFLVSRGAPPDDASMLAAAAEAGGWTAVPVDPTEVSIAQAWAQLDHTRTTRSNR